MLTSLRLGFTHFCDALRFPPVWRRDISEEARWGYRKSRGGVERFLKVCRINQTRDESVFARGTEMQVGQIWGIF